jgi:hypothetical protein
MINDTTRHAFNFLKFIFLRGLNNLQNDLTQGHFNKNFFQKVWLSLVARRRSGRPPNNDIQQARGFINSHLEDYLRSANNELPLFLYAQQSSSYEGAKIYTAYIVNIKTTFANHLCHIVNLLLNVKRRIKTMHLRARLQKTFIGVATNQK